MLDYSLFEAGALLLAPTRLAASFTKHALRSPANPWSYTEWGRLVAAGADLFEHGTRRHGKPEFGLASTSINGVPVPIAEEIVQREIFCDLKYFRRDLSALGPRRPDPKLLIVAPLSGHFATLLRGTVEAMLPDHEVYITDWRNARDVPLGMGPFDLDDYIDGLIRWIEFLGPETHVMAVCQPAVPVLAAVSILSAERPVAAPASMILMGGPIDTRRSPTAVNRFAESRPLDWFESTVITRVPASYPGAGRRVYPGYAQLAGFMAMNLERHVGAHWRMFQHLVEGDEESARKHREFYDEYKAVMDLPAEYYLQTIDIVFKRHLLPRGEWVSRGRPIDPAAITRTALATIEGENDDISGLRQTEAAHDLCRRLPTSKRLHYVQPGVGHYGVFNGRKWRDGIAPRIKAFIRAQSGSE